MQQKIICFGEMLWDLLPTGKLPGGAPMNVAVHLTYHKFSPFIISRVGNDDLGRELLLFLRDKNIATEGVQIDQTYKTGTVHVNTRDKTEVTYEIVKPAAWDYIAVEGQVAPQISQNDIFVFGSLAAREPASRSALLHYLPFGKLNVFDVNLRAPYYSPALMETLLNFAHVVKMNHQELETISGWYGEGAVRNEKEQMAFIRQKFTLQILIVTRGEKGAAVLHDAGFDEHQGYKVAVEDTIGSGDAFLATFISYYLQQQPVSVALSKACLVGAFVATQPGATPAYDPDSLSLKF